MTRVSSGHHTRSIGCCAAAARGPASSNHKVSPPTTNRCQSIPSPQDMLRAFNAGVSVSEPFFNAIMRCVRQWHLQARRATAAVMDGWYDDACRSPTTQLLLLSLHNNTTGAARPRAHLRAQRRNPLRYTGRVRDTATGGGVRSDHGLGPRGRTQGGSGARGRNQVPGAAPGGRPGVPRGVRGRAGPQETGSGRRKVRGASGERACLPSERREAAPERAGGVGPRRCALSLSLASRLSLLACVCCVFWRKTCVACVCVLCCCCCVLGGCLCFCRC